MQPCFGETPIALHGSQRDAERLRNFRRIEAAEEAQLDDLRVPRKRGRHPLQRLVHHQDVEIGRSDGFFKRHTGSRVALDPLALAGVIDQDAAHDLGSHGNKLAATLPFYILHRRADAQVKFVDQSRGLQGWGAVFVLKVVRGQPPQVLIDQTGQLLQCALRAVMPLVQPECNAFET